MNELPTIFQPAPKTKKPMTEPKPIVPSDAEQEVCELELEYEHYFSMADEMLRAIVTERRNPSFAESTFFKGRCGWSDSQIQLQVNRMSSILRYKSIAGNASQRQAASDEKATAATILANEGPNIQEAIRKLQEQFDGLERNATRAERVCEQINQAVESLRSVDFLRSDLKAKHESKRSEFAANCWDRLNSVRVEIDFRSQMLETPSDKRKHLEQLRVHFEDCTKFDSFSHAWVVDEEKWTARKRTMALELIELRDEFDRLSATREKQLAELETLLDHYLEEK